MMLNGQVLAGLLVAPLASGFAHAAYVGSLRAGLVAALVAYAASLLLGVPTVMFFSKCGWSRLWQAALAGACLGFVAAVVVLALISLANGRVVSVALASFFLPLFSFHGLLVACLFWMIAAPFRAPRIAMPSR